MFVFWVVRCVVTQVHAYQCFRRRYCLCRQGCLSVTIIVHNAITQDSIKCIHVAVETGNPTRHISGFTRSPKANVGIVR